MANKKLHLLPWSPGQSSFEWPSLAPVWIRPKGIPYHCWSSNILLSIDSSIGSPLQLDDINASQKTLSYARILVNLDLSKPKAQQILVELEGNLRSLCPLAMKMLLAPLVSHMGIRMVHAGFPQRSKMVKAFWVRALLIPVQLMLPLPLSPAGIPASAGYCLSSSRC
ncbi:hypothetical protein AAC387_Pa08g1705 [Persea americana]